MSMPAETAVFPVGRPATGRLRRSLRRRWRRASQEGTPPGGRPGGGNTGPPYSMALTE